MYPFLIDSFPEASYFSFWNLLNWVLDRFTELFGGLKVSECGPRLPTGAEPVGNWGRTHGARLPPRATKPAQVPPMDCLLGNVVTGL